MGGQRREGGPLTEAADKAGAVAGVNADFFDIGNSTAALGGQILGGTLLKSPDGGTGWNHAGVGKDGIGRLVDMTLEASATLKGATHRVLTLNAANGGGVPAGSMLAFTQRLGHVQPRARPDRRDERRRGAGAREQGRLGRRPGRGRDPGRRLRARRPRRRRGRDPRARAGRRRDAHLRPQGRRSRARCSSRSAATSRWCATRQPLPDSQLDTAIHPRTAIGFKDGGQTLLLVTADGRQDPVLGVSLRRLARFMADLGAETALNLDGGGSTTMVARPLGEEKVTVRNSPSDGCERYDPNGVGVFVKPGNGVADELVLTPGGAARVPGPAPHAEGQGDRRPRHAGGDARA